MTARALVWLLDVGWAAAWALHLGAGWLPLAVAAPAALAAAQLRRQPALAVPAWLMAAAAGALTGGPWGALLVGYALWRGAARLDPDRPAIYERLELALAGAAVLTYLDHAWAWTLPAALLLGLATTLEVHRDPGTPPRLQLGLAAALGAIGAVAGAAMLALGVFAPWGVLGLILRELALALLALFSFISPLAPPKPLKLLHKKKPHVHKGPPHLVPVTHYLAAVLLLLAAAAAVAAIRYVWHQRRPAPRRPRRPGPRDAAEARLDRATWVEGPAARRATGRAALTRRVVQAQMRRTARRRQGPRRGETVREWLRRIYGASEAALASLYEEVRYGGAPDDATRARALQRRWPKDPPAPDAPVAPQGDPPAARRLGPPRP